MITIRILSDADLPILLNPAEDLFDYPVNENLAREFLQDPHHHMVGAIQGQALVGFVSAVDYVHPDKPRELWINEVSVASAYHQQGIGKAMMREMLQLGEKLDCQNAWVLTDRSNTPANRLYLSAGGALAEGDTVMYEFELAES